MSRPSAAGPIVIDGHDLAEIDEALTSARSDGDRPSVVIARTIKGKGFKEIENKDGWHGKALPPDLAEKAIAELGGERDLRIDVRPPEALESASSTATDTPVTLPTYTSATRSRPARRTATRCARSALVTTSWRSTAR